MDLDKFKTMNGFETEEKHCQFCNESTDSRIKLNDTTICPECLEKFNNLLIDIQNEYPVYWAYFKGLYVNQLTNFSEIDKLEKFMLDCHYTELFNAKLFQKVVKSPIWDNFKEKNIDKREVFQLLMQIPEGEWVRKDDYYLFTEDFKDENRANKLLSLLEEINVLELKSKKLENKKGEIETVSMFRFFWDIASDKI